MESAEQDVARYASQVSFKRVVAPFDGVVTARLTDVGNYVNAGGGDASARNGSTELFSVADVHKLRVFVSVPQDYAAGLGDGPRATIHLPSQPGNKMEAKFLTTARAFDSNTRTAVTELTVENPGHTLWPGTYVDVEFEVPSDPAVPTVPEQALMFRAAGSQVALVDAQNHIHLRSVTLGQNLGQNVQVTAGLTAGDKLVNNPAAGLLEGQLVRPVTPMAGYAAAEPVPDAPTPDAHAARPKDGQPRAHHEIRAHRKNRGLGRARGPGAVGLRPCARVYAAAFRPAGELSGQTRHSRWPVPMRCWHRAGHGGRCSATRN